MNKHYTLQSKLQREQLFRALRKEFKKKDSIHDIVAKRERIANQLTDKDISMITAHNLLINNDISNNVKIEILRTIFSDINKLKLILQKELTKQYINIDDYTSMINYLHQNSNAIACCA